MPSYDLNRSLPLKQRKPQPSKSRPLRPIAFLLLLLTAAYFCNFHLFVALNFIFFAVFLYWANSIPSLPADLAPTLRKYLQASWDHFVFGLTAWLHASNEIGATRPMAQTIPLRYILWSYRIIGLLCGYWGIQYWGKPDQPDWLWGTPLQLLSAWFLIQSFPEKASIPETSVSPAKAQEGSSSPLFLFLALGMAGLAEIFFLRVEVSTGLLIWAGSFLLILLLKGSVIDQAPEAKRPYENWAFPLVLIATALMRFPFLHENFAGLQGDEGNNLMAAVDVMEGRLKTPFSMAWAGTPTLPYFFVGLFLKLFGPTLAVGRAASAVVSMGAIFVFYRLCRLHMGALASLVSTFLFGSLWWNLYNSFSPFHNIFSLFFEVCALFFLSRALRVGKRMDFWWTGVFLAACVNSYLAGRMAVPLVGLFLLFCLISERGRFLKAYGFHLVLTLFAFLWFFGPLVLNIFRYPQGFFGRAQSLSIFTEIHRTGDYLLPFSTLGWSFISYFTAHHSQDAQFAVQ